MEERLHKVLAHCGVASRRQCEEIIAQGRVEVNGRVIWKTGTKVDAQRDEIRVDGERVRPESLVYYLVNKPRGYICTTSDERGRPRVVDLVREERRIYPVGRLDEHSEGLILLSNDGSLANVVCHPRYQVDKTYRLNVRGRVQAHQIEKIERGVWLAEGRTSPARVRRVDRRGDATSVTVTLWEGRNRELRRMFAKIGLRVTHLVRTAIGPLEMKGLALGAFRRLDQKELGFVRERLAGDWRPARPERPPPGRWKARLGEDRPERHRPPRGGRRRGPARPR